MSDVANPSQSRLCYQDRKSQGTPEIVKILETCFSQAKVHILKKRNCFSRHSLKRKKRAPDVAGLSFHLHYDMFLHVNHDDVRHTSHP